MLLDAAHGRCDFLFLGRLGNMAGHWTTRHVDFANKQAMNPMSRVVRLSKSETSTAKQIPHHRGYTASC